MLGLHAIGWCLTEHGCCTLSTLKRAVSSNRPADFPGHVIY